MKKWMICSRKSCKIKCFHKEKHIYDKELCGCKIYFRAKCVPYKEKTKIIIKEFYEKN